MLTGTVSHLFGSFYGIIPEAELAPPKETILATLRGRLRLRKKEELYKKQRHLLTIGDRVHYTLESKQKHNQQAAIIEERLPRRNSIERGNRHNVHCLAANIDRALVIMSCKNPTAPVGFLDRFLCASHHGGVEPWIVFSKWDLLTPEEQKQQQTLSDLYEDLGYKVFNLNILDAKQSESLRVILNNGTNLFLGLSGAGKSTLLNQILPDAKQKTNTVITASNRGRHTTTNAILCPCPHTSARFIDTPGLREWELQHLSRLEILKSFPELQVALESCQFNNCEHALGSIGCGLADIWISLSVLRREGPSIEVPKSSLLANSRLRSLYLILANHT